MTTTASDPQFPPGDPAPEILEDRIWVDGCWDFFHHGHAGAMLQARQLGSELVVGVHSDESILDNKGPTVMTLEERLAAVNACRWVTSTVSHAPYVTSLPWISHYGCKYVVHGDDITTDASGYDCYRFVKEAGRFKVVKRTPSISTTDLVGRMLLCTKTHFIKSLRDVIDGAEGSGTEQEKKAHGQYVKERLTVYATDESGKNPGSSVWFWKSSNPADVNNEGGEFENFVAGTGPLPGQRVVYVDGGFDLFSSGHIEFLRQVVIVEEELGRERGWYSEAAKQERIEKHGRDYSPVFVVAGVHDDETINRWKGVNYPIMNILERGLCVLQCKYISTLVLSAPFTPTHTFLSTLPFGTPSAVYHGPTSFMPLTYDPYRAAKALSIYRELPPHKFQDVNAETIVQRIMKSRARYEERQRRKEGKGAKEGELERVEKGAAEN